MSCFFSCWRGRGYEFWHESWASTICRWRKFNGEVYSLPALIWLRSSKLIDRMRDKRRILRSYKHNIASSLPNYLFAVPTCSNMAPEFQSSSDRLPMDSAECMKKKMTWTPNTIYICIYIYMYIYLFICISLYHYNINFVYCLIYIYIYNVYVFNLPLMYTM